MKIKSILMCAVLAATALISCKEDEDETTGNYLSGSLAFSIPAFVENGDTITIAPSGVWHPEILAKGSEADSLGYYYTNPLTSVSDTIKLFPTDAEGVKQKPVGKMCISLSSTEQEDTLGTFTVTAYAFAPDYYSTSGSASFVIVRSGYGPDCSIRGFRTDRSDGTVSIDGRTFYTRKIAGMEWMRENLATDGAGTQYKGAEAMRDIFGNYYTWTEAQSACPEGWRLTSSADWDSLSKAYPHVRDLMATVTFNSDSPDTRMWTYQAEVGFPTDSSDLTILPTGYATRTAFGFKYYESLAKAVFWTSDSYGDMGVARYISEMHDKIFQSSHNKEDFAASVRCIRN